MKQPLSGNIGNSGSMFKDAGEKIRMYKIVLVIAIGGMFLLGFVIGATEQKMYYKAMESKFTGCLNFTCIGKRGCANITCTEEFIELWKDGEYNRLFGIMVKPK